MEIPQDAVVSLLSISLFVLLMSLVTLVLFRRTWSIRKVIRADLKGLADDIRRSWPGIRDRFRAWRDPEFRKRWTAMDNYRHAVSVIQRLRERAEQHYVRSEQSSFEHVRSHHAMLYKGLESKMPEVAEGMAYCIAGMSDEDIVYVSEGLAEMLSDPRLVSVPEDDRVRIGPDRFVGFLKSERVLLLERPSQMEHHECRLEEFIRREAEAARQETGDREVRDASAA